MSAFESATGIPAHARASRRAAFLSSASRLARIWESAPRHVDALAAVRAPTSSASPASSASPTASYHSSGIWSTASPACGAPLRMRPTRVLSRPVTSLTYWSSPNSSSWRVNSASSPSS